MKATEPAALRLAVFTDPGAAQGQRLSGASGRDIFTVTQLVEDGVWGS